MTSREYVESLEQFGKALLRLEEAIQRSAEDDDMIIDATIQRFEFTVELCWKALKKLLREEGVTATTPRHVLQEAYSFKWLENEDIWLRMLRDRNLTSHTYREEQAREIYERIPSYCLEFRKLYNTLTK
jgi:nucleotidyltransferase substrate binding protein (TIGR01987 family)